MKEKEGERERKKDPYGMSCHESPLKQTESLEKKNKRKEGREEGWRNVYAEDTNT